MWRCCTVAHQEGSEKELEEKLRNLEIENIYNKSRIESLETWISRQDEATKDMSTKLEKESPDKNIKALKGQVEHLEGCVKTGKAAGNEIVKNCSLCDQKFGKNCELEKHMNTEHNALKEFECDICNKTFYLKWRLEKHLEIHGESHSLKNCHYFNNKEVCPFEDFGCKFLHAKSNKCRFDECRNLLCPFTHDDEENMFKRASCTLFWPGYRADITRHRAACRSCSKSAPSNPPLVFPDHSAHPAPDLFQPNLSFWHQLSDPVHHTALHIP